MLNQAELLLILRQIYTDNRTLSPLSKIVGAVHVMKIILEKLKSFVNHLLANMLRDKPEQGVDCCHLTTASSRRPSAP